MLARLGLVEHDALAVGDELAGLAVAPLAPLRARPARAAGGPGGRPRDPEAFEDLRRHRRVPPPAAKSSVSIAMRARALARRLAARFISSRKAARRRERTRARGVHLVRAVVRVVEHDVALRDAESVADRVETRRGRASSRSRARRKPPTAVSIIASRMKHCAVEHVPRPRHSAAGFGGPCGTRVLAEEVVDLAEHDEPPRGRARRTASSNRWIASATCKRPCRGAVICESDAEETQRIAPRGTCRPPARTKGFCRSACSRLFQLVGCDGASARQ